MQTRLEVNLQLQRAHGPAPSSDSRMSEMHRGRWSVSLQQLRLKQERTQNPGRITRWIGQELELEQ